MLTVLDLVVLVLVGLAAWTGWRLGASAFLLRLIGAVLGLVLGLELADAVSGASLSPVAHLLVALACAIGGLLIGSALGARVGFALARTLQGVHLRVLDRVVGAVARALLALVACAVIAAVVIDVGPAPWAAGVRRSTLLSSPGDVPIAGPLVSTISAQIRQVAPADIAGLVPAASSRRPSSDVVDQVFAEDGPSVLPVLAEGCGSGVTGTGFVTSNARGDDLVVTNAHVVRGAGTITVGASSAPATPVLVDRRADLAVLRVDSLTAEPLPLAAGDASNGSAAVVLGYPGGGPLSATPATVLQRLPMPDPGFSDGLALHVAYRLRAAVRHGNSGSPLLDTSGRVIGVVNALSGVSSSQGYATALSELRPDLSAAAGSGAVSTGTCAS